MIRVFVADDHDIVRSGLRRYLAESPDMEVCGEAASFDEAARLATGGRSDVLVLDVNMPGGGSPAAVRTLLSRPDPPRVVVFSMYDEELHGVSFLRAGAMAFLSKKRPTRELVRAIRSAAEGRRHITPEIADQLLDRQIDLDRSAASLLSAREREVLEQLAEGKRGTEIAMTLGLQASTVHTYIQRIKEKLGAHTIVGAVQVGRDEGLL